MVGRIKKDDESVPYTKNGYWYYTRYEKDSEYPIYCRRKGSLEAEEQVIVDANVRAEGQSYYNLGDIDVSPLRADQGTAIGEAVAFVRMKTFSERMRG